MANKIIKGVMKWLLNGRTIQDNIDTEISIPESYFGANTDLSNLTVGGTDGQIFAKDGSGVKLIDAPTGSGGLTPRQKEIMDSLDNIGVPVWSADTQYITGAIVSTGAEVDGRPDYRFWQCQIDNAGFSPITSGGITPAPWQEIFFGAPTSIELTVSDA